MIKAKRQHHALVKVTLGVGVSGGDRHMIVAHALKQRRAGALRQALHQGLRSDCTSAAPPHPAKAKDANKTQQTYSLTPLKHESSPRRKYSPYTCLWLLTTRRPLANRHTPRVRHQRIHVTRGERL